jgi:hypothetical protein
MGIGYGPIVYDSLSAKRNLASNTYTIIRDINTGKPLINEKVWVDVETDPTGAWFCVFIAYPRLRSPYNASRYGSTPPHPTIDTDMNKLSDTDIQKILNNGFKETRTQWFHTSVEFGTVWADGSLTNNSTQYNLFENPSNWNSTSASTGQRFQRKRGTESSYSGWITSASGGCSGAVGGWSNYYEQSCVQSWFAGCEGGPALNHRCAGGVQDRANKLIIWAR